MEKELLILGMLSDAYVDYKYKQGVNFKDTKIVRYAFFSVFIKPFEGDDLSQESIDRMKYIFINPVSSVRSKMSIQPPPKPLKKMKEMKKEIKDKVQIFLEKSNEKFLSNFKKKGKDINTAYSTFIKENQSPNSFKRYKDNSKSKIIYSTAFHAGFARALSLFE